MGILDDINAEVAQLSDEELTKAAAAIMERRDKAKAAVTPERKAKARAQDKARRDKASAILKLAKERGLVVPTATTPPTA